MMITSFGQGDVVIRFNDKILYLIQLKSQGKGSGVDDTIGLDIHAINELQENRKVPPTNDKIKYRYTSTDNGKYSEYLLFKRINIKILKLN